MCQSWCEIWQKKLLTFSTKTTESPDIYFLWTKTKLKWSKGHLSLQIENGKIMSFWPQRDVIRQNWGEVCHKNYFNIIYLITTESCHIYFLGVKTKLKGSTTQMFIMSDNGQNNATKWHTVIPRYLDLAYLHIIST